MVIISVHCFHPFGKEVAESVITGMVEAPACIFAPDKIAVFIGFVKESSFENALVQSCAVESERLRQLYIFYKCVVCRRGIYAFGIITLIKHKTHKNGLSVYQQTCFVKLYFSHSEIRMYFIFAAFTRNRYIKIVERGCFDAP